jgi:ketosteroid isomerase-like protein
MGSSPEELVGAFLDRYGSALSAGDLETVAGCWGTPALVLADQGAVPVSSAAEVEAFFAQAIEWHRSQGVVRTRAEVERITSLSDRLVTVVARWPAFDEDGVERASERSSYVLRVGDDGALRIHVAITIGTS